MAHNCKTCPLAEYGLPDGQDPADVWRRTRKLLDLAFKTLDTVSKFGDDVLNPGEIEVVLTLLWDDLLMYGNGGDGPAGIIRASAEVQSAEG